MAFNVIQIKIFVKKNNFDQMNKIKNLERHKEVFKKKKFSGA